MAKKSGKKVKPTKRKSHGADEITKLLSEASPSGTSEAFPDADKLIPTAESEAATLSELAEASALPQKSGTAASEASEEADEHPSEQGAKSDTVAEEEGTGSSEAQGSGTPQKPPSADTGPSKREGKKPFRSASGKKERERFQRKQILKILGKLLAGLAGVAALLVLVYLILRATPLFLVTDVEIEPTEHVSAEDIENLLEIPQGTTLLNLNLSEIENSLKRNVWVDSLTAERDFPHTLFLTINERSLDTLVLPDSGSIAWLCSDTGIWIEPVRVETTEEQSVKEAAVQLALSLDCVCIYDIPSTVEFAAGSEADSVELDAVRIFREELSEDFLKDVVSFSAANEANITLTLSNGIEVYFGAAANIAQKEEIVRAYLQKYPDSILYINVKVVSNPSVRTLS